MNPRPRPPSSTRAAIRDTQSVKGGQGGTPNQDRRLAGRGRLAEPKDQKGFAALPRRWVVGLAWGWRRHSNKHVARSLASATPSLSPPCPTSRSGALQRFERAHLLFGSALNGTVMNAAYKIRGWHPRRE